MAKAAGLPVKVVWTREDDMRGGYYRPLFFHRVKVGLDAQARPLAWQHTLVGQSFLAGTPFEGMVKDGIDPTSVEGVADSPYVAGHAAPPGRAALAASAGDHAVVALGRPHAHRLRHGDADRRAGAAPPGQDPLAYRRALLAQAPAPPGRRSTWRPSRPAGARRSPAGRFRGLAVHESFGSFVAQVAEVSVEDGRIRVHRVVCAVDCGTAVNPAGVAAQMECGVVFGLSAALYGEITLARRAACSSRTSTTTGRCA